MEPGMRPGQAIAVAALVAAAVAAVVGGGAGWIVGRRAASIGPPASGRRGGHDARRDAVPRVAGAPGEDVVLGLTPHADARDVVLDLPEDAVAVRVHAETAGGEILLRARFGDDDDLPWDVEDDDGAEERTLDLADHDDGAFGDGPLVVRVESANGIARGETLHVTLRAEVASARVEATIDAGGEWEGRTEVASGFRRTIAVKVPAGAAALRADLADATTDLDLHLATDAPPVHVADAVSSARTLGTAEWLVLRAGGDPPLPAGGTVWVTVTDPSLHPFPVPFRVVTTLGEDAPPALAAVPDLPQPTDPRERALVSVVEVLTDGGGGSGTLVDERGFVLTAYHVVEAAARATAEGRTADAPPIVIAVSLDPHRIAEDLFLAEVKESDHDLDVAMLRIVRGVRGSALPVGYRFPSVPFARRSAWFLGDTLFTVGYPLAGGTGTRVTATVSRGAVSGWERGATCLRMKTDAFVSPGSSGGGAFDERWRLVGVPVSTTDGGEGTGNLGNVVPVEAVPAAWFR